VCLLQSTPPGSTAHLYSLLSKNVPNKNPTHSNTNKLIPKGDPGLEDGNKFYREAGKSKDKVGSMNTLEPHLFFKACNLDALQKNLVSFATELFTILRQPSRN
jgi:hypothetical protein